MNIQNLVRTSFAKLDAYQGVEVAKKHPCLDEGIVLLENDLPIGIITSKDLAGKNYSLLIDYLTPKPMVDNTEETATVLRLMKDSGHRILMTRDQHGQFSGIISQSDVLTHLNYRLEKQQNMLQTLAHDLRGPIASIRTLGQLLGDNLEKPENIELLSVIDKACDQGQKIIEDILASESLESGTLNLTDQNFDALVAECIDSSSGLLAQKKLSLNADLRSGTSCDIDEAKFRRVINNLLYNSIKFSLPGTAIAVLTFAEENNLVMEIRDQGIGIDPSKLEKIFDKFTDTKRIGTNGEPTTGLGLYITRQIVALHGGTITAVSDGMTGSTFIVRIKKSVPEVSTII